MDCAQIAWRKEEHQTITNFNTELVVLWIGSGSVRIRVWIGLEFDPHFCVCVCCSLDIVTGKGRQGGQAASGQLGCVAAWPYNSVSLAVWQLGCATFAAWLLDCLTAWLLDSLVAWQLGSVAVQQFVAWLLGRVNNCYILYHSKGLERSGSGVWIRGLDRLWDRGLIQTLHFEPQPYIYICSCVACQRPPPQWGWTLKKKMPWKKKSRGPWKNMLPSKKSRRRGRGFHLGPWKK